MKFMKRKEKDLVSQKETDYIEEIMSQGDCRYFDRHYSKVIAQFIKNNAIKVIKEEIKTNNVITDKEFKKIKGPQKIYKYFILKYLLSKGYELISFERLYPGGRVDLAMKKEDRLLLIECGPCRIDKAIDYLKIENSSLIIVDLDSEEGKLIIFTFERDKNWDSSIKTYETKKLSELKEIQSPLDSL